MTKEVMSNAEVLELVETADKVVNQELKNIAETVIPLLRIYLKDVREIRMAYSAEIKNILDSTRSLRDITKEIDQIVAAATAIKKLGEALNPELIMKLRIILREVELSDGTKD